MAAENHKDIDLNEKDNSYDPVTLDKLVFLMQILLIFGGRCNRSF